MIYRFNQFTPDTDNYDLKAGAEVISLEPQVFSLLRQLIDNREQSRLQG